MSNLQEHSECFSNGMTGNCNPECEVFQSGCCDAPEEFEFVWIIESLGTEKAISVANHYDCFKKNIDKLKENTCHKT